MYNLIITHNQNTIDERILKSEVVTIGQGSSNDIQLTDTTVSHQHSRLMVLASELYIEDSGSTNGTYVNGHLIEGRVRIESGDIAMIGQHKLSFDRVSEQSDQDDPEPTLQMSRNSIEQVLYDTQSAPSTPSGSKAINWVAQDKNGVWWGFEQQPVAESAGWSNFQDTMKLKLKQETPNPEWRETLSKV